MTFEDYYEEFRPVPRCDTYLSQKIKELFSRAWSISEQNRDHQFCDTPEEFIMKSMCIPMLYPVSDSRVMRDDERMAWEVGEIIGVAVTVTQLCQVARAAWGMPVIGGSMIVLTQDMIDGCCLPRGMQKES